MSEDEIAALDGDWSEATDKDRAAYAFCRRFTYEPHKLSDADIAGLRPHFTDKQILEMILSMAGNNAINRWKEGAGIPQGHSGGGFGSRGGAETPKSEKPHTYVTPTSEKFRAAVTKVAPLQADAAGKPTTETKATRPPLEPRSEAEARLSAARSRTPRLPLADEAKARELVPADFPAGPLPQWVRLLANFTTQGKGRIASQWTAETKGDLSPLLRARVAWIVARQDRAWYAAGRAKAALKALGQSDEQVYALDGDWGGYPPAERSAFVLARQLAASPIVLTDAEVAECVRRNGPRDTVQLISYTTLLASFDRITEAAGLRLEE